LSSSSHNIGQNTTTKNSRNKRPPLEVFRKIIAFEEIKNANSIKSERKIAKLLATPNSTLQSWKANINVQKDSEDAIALFFTTLPGASLLQKILTATTYNNKCGASGILGIQEFLRHSGLDKYVATSTGALQKYWTRFEDCILKFGKDSEKKMAMEMKQRKITVVLDEMFKKGKPCLVAIEPVSNYILLEKFTENRKAETWKEELENSLKGMPVKIDQVVSDLCGAIRSAAKSMGAIHSPDVFHGLYELSKATSAGLSSQERAAKKSLDKVEEAIKKDSSESPSIFIKKRSKQKERQKKLEKQRDAYKATYEEKRKVKEETQAAKKELGQIYHPIDLKTGRLQSPKAIKQKMQKQFQIIEENAEKAGLNQKSKWRIQKGARAFASMLEYYILFFTTLILLIKDANLNISQRKFFKEVVFPITYYKMIWRRLPKKDKEELLGIFTSLQKRFQKGAFPEEVKKALMRLGKDISQRFQRSSSCVEGRNGMLSLAMHRFRCIAPKTLRVLSVVHNFGARRKDDGSTAAERFFGMRHDSLFEHLVENVKIPGKPQKQIRKNLEKVA
jgi:hypothetical protein